MANPTLPNPENRLNHDNVHIEMEGVVIDTKVVVKAQEATITDAAASTATPVAVTFTSNEPTAGDTQTISDGTVPTVAELGQWVRNSEDFMAEVLVDLDLHKTAINAILTALENHGLLADA